MTNPLGTNTRKHKIVMFYAMFANVRPAFRSQLSTIQLVAIAKSAHVKKHGANLLLHDFIETVNELSTGVPFLLNGQWTEIQGSLVLVPVGTPAVQWLAGFKEGMSFATRPCRHCNVQYNDMKKHTNARLLAMRTVEEHTQRCDALEDQNLTKTAKKYWSKTLGINSRSPLSPIKHFGLTKCSFRCHWQCQWHWKAHQRAFPWNLCAEGNDGSGCSRWQWHGHWCCCCCCCWVVQHIIITR